MFKKHLLCFGLAAVMAVSSSYPAYAVNTSLSGTTMENCGAYLFEWRPIDFWKQKLFCDSGGRKHYRREQCDF